MSAKKVRKKDRKLLDEVKTKPCVVCGKAPTDPCHIKSRGSGGDDEEQNVLPLCRTHHIHQHAHGWRKFINDHPQMKTVMEKHGWELVEEFGVTKLKRRE